MAEMVFTGERIVPGSTPVPVFREHQMRYVFAGGFVRDRVVLDVASGTGIGTHLLFKCGAKVCIGIELDHASVRQAASAYSVCNFARGDAMQLCVGDEVVDVVVSFETIEHLPDPAQFLKECRRVLRPGGLLICSTPDRTVYGWGWRNPYHVYEMSREEFRDLVEDLFGNCQLYGQKEVNYPLHVTRRLISRFLERIRVKDIVRRILTGGPAETAPETEFDKDAFLPEFEVKPFTSGRIVKPTYLIAVARKPESVARERDG